MVKFKENLYILKKITKIQYIKKIYNRPNLKISSVLTIINLQGLTRCQIEQIFLRVLKQDLKVCF